MFRYAGEQHTSVFADPREECPALESFIGGRLGCGQTLRVLLKPFDAEHLGPDRLLHFRRRPAYRVDGVHVAGFQGIVTHRIRLSAITRNSAWSSLTLVTRGYRQLFPDPPFGSNVLAHAV